MTNISHNITCMYIFSYKNRLVKSVFVWFTVQNVPIKYHHICIYIHNMSFLFWVIYNPSQVGQKTVVHNTFLDAVLAKNANKPILASPPPPLPPLPYSNQKRFQWMHFMSQGCQSVSRILTAIVFYVGLVDFCFSHMDSVWVSWISASVTCISVLVTCYSVSVQIVFCVSWMDFCVCNKHLSYQSYWSL